ncbi:MAG TPA: ORF6N domain-containing protein [Bacteroidia bacterium]|nr:ORF6N domain-containing protein [Bacteroidia bacterium]
MTSHSSSSVNRPEQFIFSKIYKIRGHQVLLDRDLAALYGVETRVLNQAVKRNLERFPDDFMFQLTDIEHDNLMSQFVTSSWGGTRKLPMAFTEQGVAMLSGVLKSPIAIQVNIQIMRLFVKMRKMITDYKDLLERVEALEKDQEDQHVNIKEIYALIRQLLQQDSSERNTLGYRYGE